MNEFQQSVQDLIAEVKADIADRRITLAEAYRILTKAAKATTASAALLQISDEAKKKAVMDALGTIFDLVAARMPLSIQFFLMIPGMRAALLAAVDGIVEGLYETLIQPQAKPASP